MRRMRFFNGVVIGFLLAIGVAYMHDRSVAADPDGTRHELVNWEEFGRSTAAVGDWVREQFVRLDAQFRHPR